MNMDIKYDSRSTNLKYRLFLFARRGENGMGRCNHIGGIIFAIEDFNRCGLREKDEPVSCTSKLCGWNVPRNMKVEPNPINKIVFQKIRYGKPTASSAKISYYDPRATADRDVDPQALARMGEKLSWCLSSSSFFLFHNIKPSDSSSVIIDSICESIPIEVIEVDESVHAEVSELQDVHFNFDYDINCKAFKEIVDCYVKGQTITEEERKEIERKTRGQSENDAWKKLKETVLTASNFKKAIIRRKVPDPLLNDIMYIKNTKKVIPSLEYGLRHENDAVQCYVALHHAAGNTNLRVTEVGTYVSKETPGLGASLDRLVYDPSSTDGTEGGLEVKCPYSKRGMSVSEACCDGKFYIKEVNGLPVLRRDHAYFYQVQGQMYVCSLPWVDFLVWFGNDVVAVQRVKFDREWWLKEAMPALIFFYKRAFLPEVFTRRVKRKVPLYRNGGWVNYQQSKKLRSS